jgi:hypothetical protein
MDYLVDVFKKLRLIDAPSLAHPMYGLSNRGLNLWVGSLVPASTPSRGEVEMEKTYFSSIYN